MKCVYISLSVVRHGPHLPTCSHHQLPCELLCPGAASLRNRPFMELQHLHARTLAFSHVLYYGSKHHHMVRWLSRHCSNLVWYWCVHIYLVSLFLLMTFSQSLICRSDPTLPFPPPHSSPLDSYAMSYSFASFALQELRYEKVINIVITLRN